MNFTRRCVQMLHEDHMATLELASRIDGLLGGAGRTPPDPADEAARATLRQAADAIEREVTAHFAFEEDSMFPVLRDAAEDEICDHLEEDHRVILPLGLAVAKAARAGADNGFDQDAWRNFRQDAGDLVERLQAHVEKEESALLPLLEDTLDAEQDMALAEAYAAAR